RGCAVGCPGHGEILVRAHRTVLGRQVANMPERSQDLVAPPEILVDRFRFRRRFDDDDIHFRQTSLIDSSANPPWRSGSVRFLSGSIGPGAVSTRTSRTWALPAG